MKRSKAYMAAVEKIDAAIVASVASAIVPIPGSKPPARARAMQ